MILREEEISFIMYSMAKTETTWKTTQHLASMILYGVDKDSNQIISMTPEAAQDLTIMVMKKYIDPFL